VEAMDSHVKKRSERSVQLEMAHKVSSMPKQVMRGLRPAAVERRPRT
jgi:hypothetical protein